MNKRLNIAIAKFGFVINENNFTKWQGGMYEIINLYHILSKQHNVFIASKLDKNSKLQRWVDEPLDFIIVFNGPVSHNNTTFYGQKCLEMLEGYTWPVIQFLENHKDVPYVYLLDDMRYRIIPGKQPCELTYFPKATISGFSDKTLGLEYFHFDKIFMYNRTPRYGLEKNIQFGTMINDTNSLRTKKLKRIVEIIANSGYNVDVKGKFGAAVKMPFNTGNLQEGNTFDWLQNVKYTVNINVQPRAFSRKFFEFAMNDVVQFLYDYDEDCNFIPKDAYIRIKEPLNIKHKIHELENNPKKYQEILEWQRSLIKDEYLDGSFVLQKFNELMSRYI